MFGGISKPKNFSFESCPGGTVQAPRVNKGGASAGLVQRSATEQADFSGEKVVENGGPPRSRSNRALPPSQASRLERSRTTAPGIGSPVPVAQAHVPNIRECGGT